MKYKVGDRVKVKSEFDFYEEYRGKQFVIEECDSSDDTYLCHLATGGYRIWFSEESLEPVAPTLAEIKEKKLTCVVHAKTKREADMLFKAVDSYDHNGKTWASWWDVYKEKTCYRTNLGEVVAYGCMDNYIENGEKVIEFSDLVTTGGYCNGFRGGKKPEYSDNIMATAESISHITGIPYENSINKLKTCLGAFSNDGISAKNGGKNSMKFTFYVTEGTRVDKSCNGTIPTMTTTVTNGLDEVSVTCDEADYNERQGVLEGIAQLYCKGRFDKEYEAAVKLNKRADEANRTCIYCGEIFDTAEERVEHEKWHVERRKARRERYLLRKRAKEIAFEEQAQKLAKEMIKEDK